MILQVPGANCQFPPDMNYLFCLLCFQLVDCDKTIILYFFYKSGITESFLLNFFYILFLFFFFFFLLFKLNFSEVVFHWILTKRMWHLCKGWVLVCDNFSLVRSPQNQTATNMQGSKSSSASQQSLQCLQVSLWGLRTWYVWVVLVFQLYLLFKIQFRYRIVHVDAFSCVRMKVNDLVLCLHVMSVNFVNICFGKPIL